MSRHVQITFDAHDSRALSSFWHDVLGYAHPGPPGDGLAEGTDPHGVWDDFLARIGVPEDQRNTRSAVEDPDGHGPRLSFQQVPEGKIGVLGTGRCPHLDVMPTDRSRDQEVERLNGLGATEYEDHRKPDGTGCDDGRPRGQPVLRGARRYRTCTAVASRDRGGKRVRGSRERA